jgi:hypothetical protein
MLKSLLTDAQDQYDIGFVAWLAGVAVFLVLACITWQKFDAQQFGIGFGAVLGGGGAMSWLRKGM